LCTTLLECGKRITKEDCIWCCVMENGWKFVWNQVHYFFVFVLISRKVWFLFIYSSCRILVYLIWLLLSFVTKTLFILTTKI
jgi:hypothetical protein